MSVSLYRFHNFERGEHGVPFALCDKHAASAVVPSTCVLEKLAEEARWGCEDCGSDEGFEENEA